jgi:hypothetical protein
MVAVLCDFSDGYVLWTASDDALLARGVSIEPGDFCRPRRISLNEVGAVSPIFALSLMVGLPMYVDVVEFRGFVLASNPPDGSF